MLPDRSTTISIAIPSESTTVCSRPSRGRASATIATAIAANVSAAGNQASRCRQVRRSPIANSVELNGTDEIRDDDHSRQPITGSSNSNKKYQGLKNITQPLSQPRGDEPRTH